MLDGIKFESRCCMCGYGEATITYVRDETKGMNQWIQSECNACHGRATLAHGIKEWEEHVDRIRNERAVTFNKPITRNELQAIFMNAKQNILDGGDLTEPQKRMWGIISAHIYFVLNKSLAEIQEQNEKILRDKLHAQYNSVLKNKIKEEEEPATTGILMAKEEEKEKRE